MSDDTREAPRDDDTSPGGGGGPLGTAFGGAPPWVRRTVLVAVVTFYGAGMVLSAAARLADLLVMVGASFLVACALEPPVNALVRRGARRGLATFAVLVVAVVVLGGVAAAVGGLVAGQAATLAQDAPTLARDAVATINSVVGSQLDADAAADAVRNHGQLGDAASWLASRFGPGALVAAAQVLSSLLVIFYLVADGPRARRAVCRLLPPGAQAEVLRAWELAIDKTGGFLLSRAVLSLVTAAVSAVAFSIIGLPWAVPLAVVCGITTHFVPLVGSWLGGALPVVVALGEGTGRALAVVVFLVVFAQLRNWFVAPRLVRQTMNVHPVVGFLSAVAAGMLVGPVGAFAALPVVATVQAFGSAYLNRHEVVDSHLVEDAPPPRREREG